MKELLCAGRTHIVDVDVKGYFDPLDSRSAAETASHRLPAGQAQPGNELAARGHKFARYADDFIVTVKSPNAAKRVMASLIRFCEGRLQLVVNRAKSRAVLLKSVELPRAMEAAAHAPPQPVGTGSRSRNDAHGDAEPQRLLAGEPE